METYHKINAPFKRHLEGPNKGKLIMGDWSVPVFGYLADNLWEFTEKVDGTNIRVNLVRKGDTLDVQYGGRTDNATIPEPLKWALEGMFGDATAYARIHPWMEQNGLDEVTLYGEGYGPKIQGGGKYRNDHSFVLFDVKIGTFWLDRDNVIDIAEKLEIEWVPVAGTGTLWDAINLVAPSEDSMYYSEWGDFEAEGLVIRPVVPLFDRRGERVITKIKAKDFR